MEDETDDRTGNLELENRGQLADFCLRVQYRYYASWQGEIEQLGTSVKNILTVLWS